jgi:hypothetical protein
MFGNTQAYRSVAGNATAKLVNGAYTRLHSVHAWSVNDEDNFLHVYDAAAAADVTVGTTTPKFTYLIPAGDTSLRGAVSDDYGSNPLELKNGLVFAVTKEDGTGTTAPDVNCGVNFRYS